MCKLTKADYALLINNQKYVAVQLIKLIQTNMGYLAQTNNAGYKNTVKEQLKEARRKRKAVQILLRKLYKLQAKAEE